MAAGCQRQQWVRRVAQETSTVSRTRSMAFLGPGNHLPAGRCREQGSRLTGRTLRLAHRICRWAFFLGARRDTMLLPQAGNLRAAAMTTAKRVASLALAPIAPNAVGYFGDSERFCCTSVVLLAWVQPSATISAY